MNIPTEIIASALGVTGAGFMAALGFIYRKLLQIDARLAALEVRLSIQNK